MQDNPKETKPLMSRKLVPFVVLITLAASVGTSVAQPKIEITPFFGLRTQGAFRIGEQADNLVLEVENSASYGVFFDLGRTDSLKLEVEWTHQGSKVLEGERPIVNPDEGAENLPSTTAVGAELFDLGVDHINGGILYGGGDPTFSGYAAAGAGVSLFNPDLPNASSLTKFSFSLGAGFKTFFRDRLGFRFDARVFGTRAGDRQEELACGVFGCASFTSASTFWQVHFVGGLVVKL